MSRPSRGAGSSGVWSCLAFPLFLLLPAPRLPEVTQLHSGAATLRGLPGIAVVAEQVRAEIRPHGLNEEWLEARISRALERDTIRTLTRSDALSSDRQPLLVVRVQTVKVPGREAFAWHLSLTLYQKVLVPGARAPAALAATWQAASTIAVTSGSMLRASVGETLDDQVTEFVAAWRNRESDQ